MRENELRKEHLILVRGERSGDPSYSLLGVLLVRGSLLH
jgi:hypothetical protein